VNSVRDVRVVNNLPHGTLLAISSSDSFGYCSGARTKLL
jgi:hypothetical protein